MQVFCENSTVIVKCGNNLFCCGNNCEGQLGLGDKKNRNAFEKINFDFGEIKDIFMSGYSVLVQNYNDEIYYAGSNNWNSNLFENINCDSDYNIGKIKIFTASCDSLFIVNENNKIWCCGHNYIGGKYTKKVCGQLGFENKTHIEELQKIENMFGNITNIITDYYSTFIINDKSDVYCSGHNIEGKLGLNCDDKYITKFTKINFNFGNIIKLITNYVATYIYNDKNEFFCTGNNENGQLGLGHYDNKNSFTKINYNFGEIDDIYSYSGSVLVKNKNNELFICGHESYNLKKENKNNLFRKIDFDFGTIKKISFNHSFVVLNTDGDVFACGYNYYSEIDISNNIIESNKQVIENFEKMQKDGFDDGDKIGHITDICTGEHNLYIIDDKYNIYAFGSDDKGQIGTGLKNYEHMNYCFAKVEFDFKKYISNGDLDLDLDLEQDIIII